MLLSPAFGPPGRDKKRNISSSDTNVSVITSNVLPGFSLSGTLGTPTAAADYLLATMNRNTTLIEANEVADTYVIEYLLTRPDPLPQLQTVSVIGFIEESNQLVTMTVVAPVTEWKSTKGRLLKQTANSFRLL